MPLASMASTTTLRVLLGGSKSAEGTSQKVLPYSSRQISSRQIERELKRLSRLESEIQKSKEFLESLKVD